MRAVLSAAAAGCLFVLCATGFAAEEEPAVHDKEWWRAVVADESPPPADMSLEALAFELSGYLGSPDPELRDDIAYGVLTRWMYGDRVLPPALRQRLIEAWLANLELGIGEQGTDSVLRRSFSALMLSAAVALDNEAPYLDEPDFRRVLEAAVAYLREERDTRGFEAGKGWIHSVAHTADLLKFLGRSRFLTVADQAMILEAIGDKLTRLDQVLINGEDERLARAVLAIVARPDANARAVAAFVDGLRPERFDSPTPRVLAVNENRKHVAVSLHALLSIDERDAPSLTTARESVEALLKSTM